VTWGLIDGERPSSVVLVGVVCAIVAAALLAREPDTGERAGGRGQLLLAVAAGFGLGTSFVFCGRTSVESGNWPVLTARLAAAVLAGCAVVVLSRRGRVDMPTGRPRRLALAAGALDVAGATLLLVALRRGLAVVVAPVASLAPGVTVVLAWQVLRERISRAQVVGLGVAGIGLVLIASG
jgi:drug/metabolite transporter (DMT)-like permease